MNKKVNERRNVQLSNKTSLTLTFRVRFQGDFKIVGIVLQSLKLANETLIDIIAPLN